MGLIDETIDYIKLRRQRIINGNINCIPSPLEAFRTDFVGIEQETYYIVTGNQKSSKSQFTSFLFLYTPILYAYNNPDKLKVRILYAPLEESKQRVILRFMRHLLYVKSGFKIRLSLQELTSAREGHPVSEEVIQILQSEEYKKILDFFEEHVTFIEGGKNPTGLYKECVKYACEHGERIKQPITITDEFGETKTTEKIVGYKPYDPNEYVIILADHVGLLQEERGLDKRQTIKKFSEYMMELRDYYRYIPVAVQQQAAELQSLEAYKQNRISPSPGNLSDCKDTKNDCNVMLGLTDPYAGHLQSYFGYDITKLKNHQRFLEIMLTRDGSANAIKAMYFDGAVSYYKELPGPNSPNYETYMERVYSTIEKLKKVE